MSLRISLFPLAIASVAAAGCGWPYTSGGSGGSGSSTGTVATPQGDTPVLEEADMTAAVAPSGGYYTIFGSLTWSVVDDTNPNDLIQTIRVIVPVLGMTKYFDTPAGGVGSEAGVPFTVRLVDDVPLAGAGDTNYEIILISAGGAQSTPLVETVTLQ